MPNLRRCIIFLVCGLVLQQASCEVLANGVRPSNILGGAEQHASFSFVRPGLTQTAFAFNGPSSHQAFSSSVGDPQLAHRVLPGVANALAYRNPGLGYFGNGHITQAYAAAPVGYQPQPQPQYQHLDYQQQQALALAYQQQQQQYQPQAFAGFGQQDAAAAAAAQQQAHLSQILAASNRYVDTAVPEQIQLQQQQQQQQQYQQQVQQEQQQNLLGVAYSAAPSVAHVKVNGNGYKVDF